MTSSTVFVPKAIRPTGEQQIIQAATDRTIIVLANAGATKTTTLALRMAESWQRGTAPEHILALTYTAPACDALRQALARIGVPAGIVRRLRIQTFEAFSTQVLDEIIGASVPVHEQDEALRPFVWRAFKHVEEDEYERWRDDIVLPSLGDSGAVEDFLKLNLRLKGTLRDLIERGDNAVSPDYAGEIGVDYTQLKVFLAYERIRRQQNAERPLFRGFLDATYDLARLLHEGASMDGLRAWPFSAKAVLVDEMHDLNQAMFRVLQEILNTSDSFFCGVGDVDQVLHETTGADARFMKDELAQHTHRTIQRYRLTHSYRFARTLATKAGRLASKPYSSMAEHDTALSLAAYDTPPDCVDQVVETVRAWRKQARTRMNELAILLRHPYQSVAIENALLENDLPYTTRGFDSYLMRPEVLFIRGLLAVSLDDMNSVADEHTRENVMRALVFFSGSKIDVQGRDHESQEALMAEAIQSVREAPGFLTHFFENQIVRTAEPAVQKRLNAAVQRVREKRDTLRLGDLLDVFDIEDLVRSAYVSRQRRRDALGNVEGIRQAAMKFNTAQDYFQSLNDAEQKQRQLKRTASLVIGDIASVKGLEFDHVVLPFLQRGEFPAPTGSEREEQNLFYVGATRAKRQLTMLASMNEASSFIARMGYRPRPPAPNAKV